MYEKIILAFLATMALICACCLTDLAIHQNDEVEDLLVYFL